MGSLDKIRWGEGKITKIGSNKVIMFWPRSVSLLNKRAWIWRLRFLGKC